MEAFFHQRYFYHTPFELFDYSGVDEEASTGKNHRWVKDVNGVAQGCYASGVHSLLPTMRGVSNERIRMRFPIYRGIHDESESDRKANREAFTVRIKPNRPVKVSDDNVELAFMFERPDFADLSSRNMVFDVGSTNDYVVVPDGKFGTAFSVKSNGICAPTTISSIDKDHNLSGVPTGVISGYFLCKLEAHSGSFFPRFCEKADGKNGANGYSFYHLHPNRNLALAFKGNTILQSLRPLQYGTVYGLGFEIVAGVGVKIYIDGKVAGYKEFNLSFPQNATKFGLFNMISDPTITRQNYNRTYFAYVSSGLLDQEKIHNDPMSILELA